jgi:glyoxylase-like metal-dependent hydrolase (beta-lactamase superfamily II)/8-oxo-dGTP pyrophosphatase MutT (NUDIX family)
VSEALPGMPPAPPPAKVRDASAVILYRHGGSGPEVFWLKRDKALRFGGGFYAFPGGRLDAGDAAVPVDGASGAGAALIVAAARELFEETGVLKARGADGLPQRELDELRRAVVEGRARFGDVLAQRGCTLHASDFEPAGRWVTPPYMPVRFDARFFLVEAPPRQEAVVWPGELSWGGWTTPAAALQHWADGTALLHPPNLHAMQVLARAASPHEAGAALRGPGHCEDFVSERIEFQRGVLLYPLVTPTLPPATHTNAYVLGTGECVVVDPGSPDDAEVDRLVTFLRTIAPEGYRPQAVVLTHHHGDHVGGAKRTAEALGVPVWAHARTADRLDVPVARLLEDGDVLALAGPRPMRWRVLHTPGHARGHVALVDEATKAAVVGDMVAGVGTIVIDPPEGDMAEYLAQLRRLAALPVSTLYPAHGPAIPDGVAKLEEYLAHRAWREAKVLEAVASFARPVALDELVPRAYDDVASFVLPIAERSTQAILDKLEREGRLVADAQGWRLR